MSGLREHKKRATREALSWAALRLAVERGVENVLVEDIAAAAEVSPRTFNNYFASKYEAIVWRELDRMTQIGDLLRARPQDEPLWDAITHAVLAVYGGDHADSIPDRSWLDGVRLLVGSPGLVGEFLKADSAMERVLAGAIADRIGAAPADMFPRVTAAAVTAAASVAQQQWIDSEPPVPLGPLIRTALRHLTELDRGVP
ncbi:MAG: TetR family transcriptional regulator [Kibdelosporangium sp.]